MEPPLSSTFEENLRRVQVVYARQPTIEEWITTMQSIFSDPRFQPGFGVLLDRRKVTKGANTEYIRKMVAFIDAREKQVGYTRWAILVTDIGSYGVGRMAEQIGSTNSIRTCRSMEEANIWLAGRDSGLPANPQISGGPP